MDSERKIMLKTIQDNHIALVHSFDQRKRSNNGQLIANSAKHMSHHADTSHNSFDSGHFLDQPLVSNNRQRFPNPVKLHILSAHISHCWTG
jgi:hypothetical protein